MEELEGLINERIKWVEDYINTLVWMDCADIYPSLLASELALLGYWYSVRDELTKEKQ